MCVICYIPKGIELPSESRIRAMWDTNPDGAGLFWIAHGEVHISKGYFNFDSFYKDILIIKDYDYELAIHMRIATAGGISQRMCHPFPISNKKEDLFNLNGSYDSAIMHNGIIHIQNREEYSDTAEFVVTNLYSRYLSDKRFYKHLSPKATRKLEESINGSRMLFFGGDGSIKMIGRWSEKNGCYYSNLNFEWRERTRKTYEYFKNYGYDCDFDDGYGEDEGEVVSYVNYKNKKRQRKRKNTSYHYHTYKEYCMNTYGGYPFEE